MAKTFHIITLGCKVNQYESEALREAWLDAGHCELASADGADLVLINSCAITAKAVADLRALARRVRAASPGCELLVTGCAAQALPGELAELPIDALVPQSDKLSLLRWLGDGKAPEAETAAGEESSSLPSSAALQHEAGIDPAVHFTLLNLAHTGPDKHSDASSGDMPDFWANAAPEEESTGPQSSFPAFSISAYARSRAVLKIHDGCSQHCTYCIVPQGRGPSVSRPWPESVAEAGRLIQAGFREIVLSGVNLRQYGSDLAPPEDFWDFATRLEAAFADEWAGRLRLRISSLEPGQLNAKGLAVLAKSRLIAPQLHLSIQSGSQRILKRMGRGHYDPASIAGFLAKLAKIWPMFGLGADFICGFPGESGEDFTETLSLVDNLPFTYAHVFPYSKRPGTAAAKLPGQIPAQVKKERAARLRALMDAKKEAFLQRQLALSQVLLAPEDGRGQGVNEFYSECRFTDGYKPTGKELIAARPAGIEKRVLLVNKITTNR